jgi:hypothetical protein
MLPRVEEKTPPDSYDPLISIVALPKTLERQFSRTFTRVYFGKQSDKVAWYTLVDSDRAKIKSDERMNFTRENCRMVLIGGHRDDVLG